MYTNKKENQSTSFIWNSFLAPLHTMICKKNKKWNDKVEQVMLMTAIEVQRASTQWWALCSVAVPWTKLDLIGYDTDTVQDFMKP